MLTLKITKDEAVVLLDALKKGAARHDSYAKFYNNRKSDDHFQMARAMDTLATRIFKAQ
jgi:hypothetical protein